MSEIVLLDRDGTINEERNYLASEAELVLLPRAAEGIRRIRGLGLPIAVVTNQSGIARGFFDLAALARVHRRLEELLKREGAYVDGFYVCPHGPDDDCPCRKPRPGLALRAAEELGGDLSRSFVVGDKGSDMEFGRAVGATTILVRTGYGEQYASAVPPLATVDYCVADLRAAAELIDRLISTA